ncbi:MAG: hypothetical protein D8M57_04110 [Candidatus Scalindua sp. AMX11]|nr:MAG: hypothetical protein DWQ00_10585 [Candidatus Scalindua sp.]NOG82651.1 hypothetical protein [Planctomycetota bacterium]RZV95227.1 MAG: hypothetical protein EX341_02525 [Candidatus Scalindua sp. SCAELEC01]TDE66294.1 MAG: hypothetical protein D8M57_04110 [Candidatus Scalindua sp. AMX11]GJQ57918.1 MAG: hypothetical protein SCALA701_07190 [Candidatus Scalindua sp.]
MHIDIKLLFSGISVAVSMTAITVSYLSARKAGITGIRPVLVFCFNSGSGWSLKNIGNGPALNIVLALLDADNRWVSPEGIPSLAVNGEFVIGGFNTQIEFIGWGCFYTDISASPYSSTQKGSETQIVASPHVPAWNSAEIEMRKER